MTEVLIRLPDELAQRARSAGLLTDGAIQDLLEDAMRRRSGRRFLEVAAQLRNDGIAPMTQEEIDAEVRAVRAERTGPQDTRRGADRS